MRINSNFDSGNIEVVSMDGANNIRLKIRKDIHATFSQWFHFHLTGVKGQACKLHLVDVNETTFPKGWSGYRAFVSYDRKEWFRVPTDFDGKQLIISHTPQHDSIYFAYFVPYSYERHQDFISAAQLSPYCQVQTLCHTIDDHELSLMVIGQPSPNKRSCWIVARQHPGETMGAWFCEGLVHRLLDASDSLTMSLLAKTVFYIVPNMNPDGCINGNIRANGAGVDLNRQWNAPDKNTSPEVYCVQKKMAETGVDFFLDVHGDENLPFVYTIDRSFSPNHSPRIQQLEHLFRECYQSANADFQHEQKPAAEDLPPINQLQILAAAVVGDTYDCLSFTIEMPFQDYAKLPDEKYGWSDQRSMQLGRALLDPLAAVVGKLR